MAGEIVRATSRIGYRWYNDGDCIGVDYGNETCNAAARFLEARSSYEVGNFISQEMWGIEYDEDIVEHLCELVIEDLENRPELLTENNSEDLWNYYDKIEDEAYLDDLEDEWQGGESWF